MQRNFESSLRGDQGTPRRLAKRGRIDGNVPGEHGGNKKSRTTRIEICGEEAAGKRLAGWTRDGSTEEIASWSVEAERLSREVEAKKRKLQEAIEKESTMKDVRMSDEGLDGLDGSLSS